MEAISSDNYTFLDSKIENLLNNLKCQDNLGFAQDYFDPELLSASDIQIANHRVRRYCLIATDTNNNSELKKTLKLEGYDENFSQFLIDELDRYGYACIEYRRSSTDCTQLGNKIAEKHHELTKTYFHFQVIKVYRYFFMNLAPQLISLIHELCSLKSKLARTLTNYLSNENSFLSTFVQNENKLWKHFRFLVLKRLLIIFFSFEEGKRQIADFYLQNFSKIYHLSLPDSFGSVYSLLKLSVEFTTDHYIIKYLFGNRLLCNIIDAMSKIVKTIVLKYGEQSTISNMEIDRILLVGDSFLRFLSIDLKIESCFSEFEPELKREGDRIILLCLEFDTYEFSFDNYFTLNDSRLPQIIFKLQEILVKFIQWLCLDLKTLEGILRKQLREFKRIITSNPSEVEDLTYSNPAVDQSPYEHGIKELFEKIRSQPSEIHKLMTVERHMKNKILVPLPTHYNDLKENLNFKCSICNCVTKTMCKCLICGLNIPIENSCSCISINPVPPPKLLKEQIVNHSLSCDGTYGIYLKVESPRVIITEWYEARTVEFSLYRGSCGESMYSTQENLTLSEQKYNQLESIYQNDELGSLHYQSTKL